MPDSFFMYIWTDWHVYMNWHWNLKSKKISFDFGTFWLNSTSKTSPYFRDTLYTYTLNLNTCISNFWQLSFAKPSSVDIEVFSNKEIVSLSLLLSQTLNPFLTKGLASSASGLGVSNPCSSTSWWVGWLTSPSSQRQYPPPESNRSAFFQLLLLLHKPNVHAPRPPSLPFLHIPDGMERLLPMILHADNIDSLSELLCQSEWILYHRGQQYVNEIFTVYGEGYGYRYWYDHIGQTLPL